MQRYQTGRAPAVRTHRSLRAALALAPHLSAWGRPPASTNWRAAVDAATGGDWGMFGNDVAGDCVWADSCHQVMLHTANAGQIVVPTTQDAIGAYSAVTGYVPGDPSTDRGTDEVTACDYLHRIGIAGHKEDIYAPINPANLDYVRWTVAAFGACRLGILVDQGMEDLFEARQPWVAPAANGDGHDVPIVDYDADWFYVATWGRADQRVHPDLISNPAFCDEAHAELWLDWIRAMGTAPDGASLAQLEADLRYIGAEDPVNLAYRP